MSETVFIPLEQGDTLHMEQVEGRGPNQTTTVKRITFCVLLLHLDMLPSFSSSMFQLPSYQSPKLTPYRFKTVDRNWIDEIENIIESTTVITPHINDP